MEAGKEKLLLSACGLEECSVWSRTAWLESWLCLSLPVTFPSVNLSFLICEMGTRMVPEQGYCEDQVRSSRKALSPMPGPR